MKKIIFIIIAILLFSCSAEKAKNRKGHIIKDRTSSFEQICIEGHVYYFDFRTLAIKVNDNGLPEKCQKIKELK